MDIFFTNPIINRVVWSFIFITMGNFLSLNPGIIIFWPKIVAIPVKFILIPSSNHSLWYPSKSSFRAFIIFNFSLSFSYWDNMITFPFLSFLKVGKFNFRPMRNNKDLNKLYINGYKFFIEKGNYLFKFAMVLNGK